MCQIVKYKRRFTFNSIFKINHGIVADNELSRADDESFAGSVSFLFSFPIENLHTDLPRKETRWCFFLYLHRFLHCANAKFTFEFYREILMIILNVAHSQCCKMICSVLIRLRNTCTRIVLWKSILFRHIER